MKGQGEPQKSERRAGRRLPPWIRRELGSDGEFRYMAGRIRKFGIETICTNARCPNQGECWSQGTATVLILGNICTRNCPFCAVGHGIPEPPDPTERERVAALAQELELSYLVITSVDRDDLPDGGAGQFRRVVEACRALRPSMRFELLVPDFKGCREAALAELSRCRPFVFGHNIETVPRLYPIARPGGDYRRSLELLAASHESWPDIAVKSSLMLGLGESDEEIEQVMRDLLSHGCTRISLGQYLQPTKEALEVREYVTPERFTEWGDRARELGFTWVQSSPLTRSSYHADKE